MARIRFQRRLKDCKRRVPFGFWLVLWLTSVEVFGFTLKVDPCYEKPFFTTIGLTDEACSAVYGWCEGEISRKYLEESEVIEVVLADREEAKRILKEENVAIMCSYHLMHFIHDEEPFAFLK